MGNNIFLQMTRFRSLEAESSCNSVLQDTAAGLTLPAGEGLEAAEQGNRETVQDAANIELQRCNESTTHSCSRSISWRLGGWSHRVLDNSRLDDSSAPVALVSESDL